MKKTFILFILGILMFIGVGASAFILDGSQSFFDYEIDTLTDYIVTFDYNDGYGHTQIQTILRLKSVHSKNLHYYICRYKTLINSNTGYKVNISTLTKYLGINKLNRPYKQLIQIIDKYNKEMMDSGYELIVIPTKKGKKGQVLQIILKMQPIKQLKYTNTRDRSNYNKIPTNNNNRGDDWF